jgi:hypothetical protein
MKLQVKTGPNCKMMDNDDVNYDSHHEKDRVVSFGKEMREKHFLFRQRHINLNHGMQSTLKLAPTLELEAKILQGLMEPIPALSEKLSAVFRTKQNPSQMISFVIRTQVVSTIFDRLSVKC